MQLTIRTIIISLTIIFFFNGCSQQEVTLDNTLENGIIASPMFGNNIGTTMVANTPSSSIVEQENTQIKLIGSQKIKTVKANKKIFNQEGKLTFKDFNEFSDNLDQVANSMKMKIVQIYNKKHGTNFKSFMETQDYVKVKSYNKQQGTNFKTLTEARQHYNKKNGTNFKTDQELRDYFRR